jgi:hypothetical protein
MAHHYQRKTTNPPQNLPNSTRTSIDSDQFSPLERVNYYF